MERSIAEGRPATPSQAPAPWSPATVVVGILVALAALALYTVSNPEHYNQYTHFVWQADAFLHGRAWFPHPVPDGAEFSAYSVLPSGADSTIVARRGDVEVTIRVMGISKIKMDQKVWLSFLPETLNLFDKASGNLISH